MECKADNCLIDFSDQVLRERLPTLLKNRTTGNNIIWATDPPPELGVDFADEITMEQLDRIQLVPRVQKRLEEQKTRTRKKAEVFTPTHICKKMIDLGIENGALRTDDWKTFIEQTCLEITCGEAPFLTSRYDTATGKMIAVPDRIGLLDRKLKAVTDQFANDHSLWLNWALTACMSVYGYEWQGDNLILSRANVFLTVVENFRELFGDELLRHRLSQQMLDDIADTISWNILQMDGLKGTVPGTDIQCVTYNWRENKKELFYHEDIEEKDAKKKIRRKHDKMPHQDQESILSKGEG